MIPAPTQSNSSISILFQHPKPSKYLSTFIPPDIRHYEKKKKKTSPNIVNKTNKSSRAKIPYQCETVSLSNESFQAKLLRPYSGKHKDDRDKSGVAGSSLMADTTAAAPDKVIHTRAPCGISIWIQTSGGAREEERELISVCGCGRIPGTRRRGDTRRRNESAMSVRMRRCACTRDADDFARERAGINWIWVCGCAGARLYAGESLSTCRWEFLLRYFIVLIGL